MREIAMLEAKILLDSCSQSGARLTTFEITMWRYILPEFNKHRALSSNTASTGAIPMKRQIQMVEEDPAWPLVWPKNQPGMEVGSELSLEERSRALAAWKSAWRAALVTARQLTEIGVHKRIAGRILEPFRWVTMIVSATDWDNFYALRLGKAVQPEFRALAELMLQVQLRSRPNLLSQGEWHLPLLQPGELESLGLEAAKKVSVARCCRVSYMKQGKIPALEEDTARHDSLLADGHMSPFEHQGTPAPAADVTSGNFTGFIQYRKLLPGECVRSYPPLRSATG
jgi:thymidylate synthase ThyX